MKKLLKAKSEFRKRGVTLIADKTKSGGGGSWKFASEDNLIKQIQEPLTTVGLEYVATLRAMPELNLNMVVGTLYHVDSGEVIESSKILETPVPKKDRNGNPMYLDAEIETGKQFGYWSRVLAIRLLGLSDLDPEDMQNAPTDITDEAQGKRVELLTKLTGLIDGLDNKDAAKAWVFKTFKVTKLEDMPTDHLQSAVNTIEKKKNANS